MPRDYDKPKKSWREIDQGKDKSSHRKDGKPGMNPFKQAKADSASKAYKSKLDNFFNGEGKAPAHVAEKFKSLDNIGGGKERKAAVNKIKDAVGSQAKTKEITAFLKNWELPEDYDVIVEVLACGDDDYISMALEVIETMFAANRSPKRSKILEQRLKTVVTLAEEPTLQEKAKDLIKQLRMFQ